jgi:hypothetical protein
MRRLGALLILVTACGGRAVPATTAAADSREWAAEEFALSADRALDGTRFAEVTPATLAAVVAALCAGTVPLVEDVARAIAGIEAPAGPPADGVILTEVLVAGVVEVCPERVAADLSAAYLASVRFTIEQGAGVSVGDEAALTTGLSACAALDGGDPGDALVTIAAGLFDAEGTLDQLLAGAIDGPRGTTAGAVLSSAVTYLCPEHAAGVEEFVAELRAGADA